MKTCLKYLVLLFCVKYIEGAFRCDYKYSAVAEGWFKHFVIPATWYDARLRCALEGAVLASPSTPELAAEILHIIKHFFILESEIFTGIHATFSQGDYYTVEGTPLREISLAWADNEPDNLDNKESCITLNGKGDLADRPCGETRPYICYRAGDSAVNECGTTDSEYRLNAYTNSCYKFHSVPRTFSRAYFACSAEGGYLAIINSEAEAKILKEIFAKYPGGKMVGNFWKDVAFIGVNDWGEHGEWRTIHGQTLWEAGYSRFSGGEPNNATTGEYCGSIYRSGYLNDLWCDKPAAFICEKKPDYPAVCDALPDKELVQNAQSEQDSPLLLENNKH